MWGNNMRPTLKITSRDVARRAGVSQSTVSKVANNSAVITPETRARVVKAAHDLGYPLIPRNSNYQVALIFPGNDMHGYVGEMLAGLTTELLKKNIKLEIVSDDHLELLNERCVNCAISINWQNNFYDHYRKILSLPLIRINGISKHYDNVFSVYPDGIKSLEFLIDKLWKLNHRKIGFFFYNSLKHELNNLAKRREGFLQAMYKRGAENPEEFCAYDCLDRDVDDLAELLQKWYDAGVTALIFSNSRGTAKMMHIVQKLNIMIPEQLSLIGWEASDVSNFTTPPLSTLNPDPREMAQAAINLLEQIMTHRKNIRDIIIPYRWIERNTIAEARTLENLD